MLCCGFCGWGRLVRRTLFLGALAFCVFRPDHIEGQAPAHKVLRGQEIFVSFSRSQAGVSAQSSRRTRPLRLPTNVRLRQTLSNGSLGILSASSGASSLSQGEELVDADEAALRRLCSAIRRSNKAIARCEPNFIVEADATPNDALYPELWGMSSISAPLAWDIGIGSPSVVVAVVDTGIDYRHPDLAANIAINPGEVPSNGADDDGNGLIDDAYGYDFRNMDPDPMDDHFHGTHCAGIIAARGNNGRGVAGVAWNVRVLPIKVLNANGNGTYAHVTAGVNYAVRRGARIINMSLGGTAYSKILEDAVLAAQAQGVLIVAAAGNAAINSEVYPYYPASLGADNIISVAALTPQDTLTFFSNWGPKSVDIGAPGEDILSTALSGQYMRASGTSMASPHVAGIAALMLSVNPALKLRDIKSIILRSADPLPDLAGLTVSGGRADAFAAVTEARQLMSTPTPTSAPSLTPAPTPQRTPPARGTPTSTAIPSRPIYGSTSTPIPAATITPASTPRSIATPVPTARPTSAPPRIPTAMPPFIFSATPTPTPTAIPAQTTTIPSRPFPSPLPTTAPTSWPTIAPTSPMPGTPTLSPPWNDTEPLALFMTSKSYSSDLGGIEGARQKCQELADAVPALAGTRWFPLLSDGTFSALSLTGASEDSGPISNMDGSVIAPNRAALWNTRLNPLTTGLHNTETGERVHAHAFTGTDATGRATQYHCGNWTGQGGSASLGLTNTKTAFWVTGNQSSCSYRFRLICLGAKPSR